MLNDLLLLLENISANPFIDDNVNVAGHSLAKTWLLAGTTQAASRILPIESLGTSDKVHWQDLPGRYKV